MCEYVHEHVFVYKHVCITLYVGESQCVHVTIYSIHIIVCLSSVQCFFSPCMYMYMHMHMYTVHVHAHVHCAVSYIVHCKRIYSYPLPQVPYLLDVLLAHLAVFPEGTCMHIYFYMYTYMSEMLNTYMYMYYKHKCACTCAYTTIRDTFEYMYMYVVCLYCMHIMICLKYHGCQECTFTCWLLPSNTFFYTVKFLSMGWKWVTTG